MKKMNVESFNLDHTKVAAPYIRLASTIEGEQGDTIYKYDLRFTQPNVRHMDMPSIHSLEHLMAEISRNYSDRIVDISPMGCQTGYYLSILNENDTQTIFTLIENVLEDVLRATEVPACNVVQCGWAESHSLEGAQQLASDMLQAKEEWHIIFQEE